MREFEAQIGKTNYLEGGYKAFVEVPLPKPKTQPGSTALHEAMHVVAARENGTGVESATIIAGEGYLGLTTLSRPDAIAALGPHSMGASGTSYDVYIAGLIGSAGAESAARAIVASNMDKVEAVASALQDRGTIDSSGIDNAIRDVENPAPILVDVFLESPKGDSKKLSGLEVIDGRVKIREEVVIFEDLPKAA